MSGITFDTGALLALERERMNIKERFSRARRNGVPITVPAVVLTEWWREGFGRKHRLILEPLKIEDTTDRIATAAGAALTRLAGPSAVDAIVMASAALRGDVVYTADYEDLSMLQTVFPNVRLFRV